MDKTFRDFLRMCVANKDCKDCPIKNRLESMCYTGNCNVWMNNNLELAENIVSQWAAEHPETTYRSYFMERFPKANMRHCCVAVLFGESERLNNCKDMCVRDCDGCWNRPIKEG